MRPDHELHAALSADVADERQAEVDQLRAEVRQLKGWLLHEVLDRAGFVRQPGPGGAPYRRDAGLGALWFSAMPLSPDQARDRLAAYGIPVTFTEEQTP